MKGKRLLWRAGACVALCVAVLHACGAFTAGVTEPQEGHGLTSPDSASCRALFTITGVPRTHAHNVTLVQHLQGRQSGDTLSSDWRDRHYPATDVAAAVQQLIVKRDSLFGPSTSDYTPLAAALPSLLAFQGEGEGGAPTLTTTTRIGAAGGLLPYVPCQIATYADLTSVSACFRRRVAQQDAFWIFFMGDSKVRFLFYEFLAKSDQELHYLMKLPNGSTPFAELQRDRVRFKVDMEATSTKIPGLVVSFQFRKFYEDRITRMLGSAEVQQLTRWAAGHEAPPHLLVLGYAAWATRKMEAYLYDTLGVLIDMHKMVASLLQQISHRTRVLVASQSRYKVHADAGNHEEGIPFGDPTFDWSDAMLLYHLRRQALHHPPPQHGSSAAAVLEPTTHRGQGRARDHLVPEAGDSGVWWWDSNLPLSLAENGECDQLYYRGLSSHPLYSSTSHKCTDAKHAGAVTYEDQVTMLLNLMCNTVLGSREGLCCG